MEFDINRVYTAVNADEVKPGSKVFGADNLNLLRRLVKEGYCPDTLNTVHSDEFEYRFDIDNMDYMLVYLVSEPKEPRRMTNRELAKWLAQGNGQWLSSSYAIGMSYSYAIDNNEIPDGIKIRGWDEAEWHEPLVEEED